MTVLEAQPAWSGSLREGAGAVALESGAAHPACSAAALAGVQIVLDAALD